MKVDELLSVIRANDKEIEHWRGKKCHKGPRLTHRIAYEFWFESWNGWRDDHHIRNVKYEMHDQILRLAPIH